MHRILTDKAEAVSRKTDWNRDVMKHPPIDTRPARGGRLNDGADFRAFWHPIRSIFRGRPIDVVMLDALAGRTTSSQN